MVSKFAFDCGARRHEIGLGKGFAAGYRDKAKQLFCRKTSTTFYLNATHRKHVTLAQCEGYKNVLLVLADGDIRRQKVNIHVPPIQIKASEYFGIGPKLFFGIAPNLRDKTMPGLLPERDLR